MTLSTEEINDIEHKQADAIHRNKYKKKGMGKKLNSD